MKTKTLTIVGILSLVTLMFITNVASITITDEPYSFYLDNYAYYELIGINESDISITIQNTLITIQVNKYLKDTNFSIIFYDEKDEVVESFGGGGGSSKSSGFTFKPSSSQMNEGYVVTLRQKDKIKWDDHLLTVNEIKEGNVSIRIASKPMNLLLKQGDKTYVNLDDDCIFDLLIDTKEVKFNSVKLSIQKVEFDGGYCEEVQEDKDEEINKQEGGDYENNSTLYIAIFLLAVSFVTIILLIILKIKK